MRKRTGSSTNKVRLILTAFFKGKITCQTNSNSDIGSDEVTVTEVMVKVGDTHYR